MTREEKKKRHHKIKRTKKMSSRSKKIAEGTASVLLGTGIMMGANVRPVKAAGSREDEITEVETANVLSNEKASVRIGVKQIAKDTQTEQLNTNETAADVAESNEAQITTQSDDVVNEGAVQGSETASANNTQAASTEGISEQQASSDNQQISNSVGESDNNGADVNPQTNQASNSGGLVGATTSTAEVNYNGESITPQPGNSDAENKAEEANKSNLEYLKTELEKIQDELKDLGYADNVTITPSDEKNPFFANGKNINQVIDDLTTYTIEQLSTIQVAVDKYKSDMAAYNDRYKSWENFINDLEKYGLWKKDDTDPSTLTQDLVFGDEENAIVTAVSKNPYVTENESESIRGKDKQFLDTFYWIRLYEISGEFLTVTYTGLENTKYKDQKIDKIVITFSDWKYNDTYEGNRGSNPGIYFDHNPANGFWYVKSDGVTMDMQLYSGDKVVNLGDNAYFVTGSMNSEGHDSDGNEKDYIEKAQIINGTNSDGSKYGGEGISLPESEVTVHKDPNGGGDILYSDYNINFFDDKISDTDKISDLIEEAEKIWPNGGGKYRVEHYLGWDATPDEGQDNTRKIFGTGLFKVSGNRIKVRFSNRVGSGWSTYSSEIPDLTFNAEKPKDLVLNYTSGEITVDKSTVTLHYMDVNDLGENEITPGSGDEIRFQGFGDLIVGDKYNISNLWNWENQNYELFESDELGNIEITKDHKDVYIYLKHKTKDIDRDMVVNQTIHYRADDENKTQLQDDYTAQLTFHQDGKQDLVTGDNIWDDMWNIDKTFSGVDSPATITISNLVDGKEVINHYHLIDQEKDGTVGPIKVTVNTNNFGEKLDIDYTVWYTQKETGETTRRQEVSLIIQYRTKDGADLGYPDYTMKLTFEQNCIIDVETQKIIWYGEWTQTQTFAGVVSPDVIGHYHIENKENDGIVGPIEITVTNDNYGEDQNIKRVIYYVPNEMEDTERKKEVHQIIHYHTEDETPLKEDYTATLVFTQKGKLDKYTGKYEWNGEWTPEQIFKEVESPTILGHYHLKYTTNDKKVEAIPVKVTNENVGNDLDETYTVYYIANPTEETSRDKTVTQTIHYVYENGGTAYKDYTAKLTFTQPGILDIMTDAKTWDENWSETKGFESVKSPSIEGYYTDQPFVVSPKIEVNNGNFDSDLNIEVYVVYKADPTEETGRDKTVTQTIHYVYEDGTPADKDHTATLIFTQNGIKHTATGEIEWDSDWTLTQTFVEVKSPEINGYHTDILKIDAEDIIVNNANFDKDLDKVYQVIYVANGTETKQETNEVHRVVHYVDEEGNEIHTPSDEATIVFERDIVVDAVDGRTISIGEWRPKTTNAFDAVESPDITNWVLKDEKDKTAGAHTDVKAESGTIHDYVVYVHDTETISRDKTVTQTIHYVYENGDPAHEDYTVTLTFTQTGVRDKVTGVETWDENWTQTQTFQTKGSPEIAGYTADKKEVGSYEITVNDGNFGENLDKEDTVTYKVNSVTPDPGTDPNPDPQPTVPDPTPTPTPDPERPLPEEPTNPSNPAEDDNEKHDNDENPSSSSHKVETNRSDTNNGKVGPIADTTKSDKQTSPQNLSNNNGGTDQVQTNVKQDDQATLPATGEKEDDVAKLMSGLSAALGLTGLVAASRRRKVTAKRNRKNKKHGK